MLYQVTDFILNWFDLSAMIIATIGAYFYGTTKNSLIIISNLYIFNFLSLFNLTYLNEYYYFIVSGIEGLFILSALLLKANKGILIIFLISFSYNAISGLDFSFNSSIIDLFYVPLMMILISMMVLSVFREGSNDGRSSDHSSSDSGKLSDYSRLFYWGTE